MSSLLTIKGCNMGVRHRLEDATTTIGRGPENNIQLFDDNVSRIHAEIRRERLAYTIYDKGSRNGVFVNGNRVEQKLLRRNDEIVIGSTHFLFDSDFEVKNALFTNKSVYMGAPTDETVYRTVDSERSELLDDFRRGELRLLEQIGNLVASADVSLPTVSEKILTSIVEIVGARRAVVMQWDPAARALVPLAALCDEDQLAINRAIADQVFHERRAILASDVTIDLRYAQRPQAQSPSASVICVPVGTDSHCEGVIYVDSDERDRFSLRDVAVLVAVGRLFYVALRMARLHDRVESVSARRIEMVGKSAAFRAVLEQSGRVAAYDTPVLITGETGTGKELLAREIHARSRRSDGPFVAINCSAIPETLFESELFGHEKGAFTGAAQLARGKIEIASGGTLFLDEIGEMSLATQPKILHFLQDHVFYRVGGTRPIHSDVRIIAATNKDLGLMVEQSRFRADLLFRLNVVQLHLPPLRERPDDIPALVDWFVGQFSAEMNRPVEGVTDEAMRCLMQYNWPGNIRELANCLERAILLSDRASLDVADFLFVGQTGGQFARPREATYGTDTVKPGSVAAGSSGGQTLAEIERNHILAALERNNWNQLRAAEELGIHRNTLRNKIHEYGLVRKRPPN